MVILSTRRGPGQGVALELLNIRPLAQNEPRLGPSQQLVPAEGDHVHPGLHTLLDRGFAVDAEGRQIHQGAAAQILDDRQAVLLPKLHQLRQGGPLGEAHVR